MSDRIKICALGGLDEKGRDCYIVEINDDIFVLDCGCSLPDKSLPGVDYIIPNPDYLIKNKHRVKGFFISHGHDESMAGVKYFWKKVQAPIYCSSTTRRCMEGQARLINYEAQMEFKEVPPSCEFTVSGRKIIFFQVPHNMANASGIAIDTDRGWIIFTSDFIVDFSVKEKNYYFDLKMLEYISQKDTFLMLAESKAVSQHGYCSPKHKTYHLIEKYFKEAEKRIFICSSWQNIYRVEEIITLCKTYKKKVCLYDNSTKIIFKEILTVLPSLAGGLDIIDPSEISRVRSQDVVILMLGMGNDLFQKIKTLSKGENRDKRISLLPSDIYIVATLPLPMQETMATRAIDGLYRTGCEVVWIKKKDVTSMHAQQDDLKYLLSVFRPKYYLPVRGNYVNLINNAKLALSMEIGLNHSNVFILDNGMVLSFEDGARPKIIPNSQSNIDVSPVLVDGKGLIGLDTGVIEERIVLSEDGVVIIAATISKSEKRIIAGPDCQMRGFVFVKEAEPLLKTITNIFLDEIKTALEGTRIDLDQLTKAISDRASKFIKRENGRQPYVLPIIKIVD